MKLLFNRRRIHPSSNRKLPIDMQETVDVLASFNARHVVFWLARAHEVEDPVEAVHLEQNAFLF